MLLVLHAKCCFVAMEKSALTVGSPFPEGIIKQHFYGSHLLTCGFLPAQNVAGTLPPAHGLRALEHEP